MSEDYSKLNKKQLQDEAKKKCIRGFNKLKKEELRKKLEKLRTFNGDKPDYSDLTKTQLQTLAKSACIPRFSKMPVKELRRKLFQRDIIGKVERGETIDQEVLMHLDKPNLKALAKVHKIKGFGSMKKSELIKHLSKLSSSNNQANNESDDDDGDNDDDVSAKKLKCVGTRSKNKIQISCK